MTQSPGSYPHMPSETLTEDAAYNDRLDIFSFGVLMTAVITRREPSGDLLHSERSQLLADGSKRVIPETQRRARDIKAIPAEHPLRGLILRCLQNDPNLRPSTAELQCELLGVQRSLNPTRPTVEEVSL